MISPDIEKNLVRKFEYSEILLNSKLKMDDYEITAALIENLIFQESDDPKGIPPIKEVLESVAPVEMDLIPEDKVEIDSTYIDNTIKDIREKLNNIQNDRRSYIDEIYVILRETITEESIFKDVFRQAITAIAVISEESIESYMNFVKNRSNLHVNAMSDNLGNVLKDLLKEIND